MLRVDIIQSRIYRMTGVVPHMVYAELNMKQPNNSDSRENAKNYWKQKLMPTGPGDILNTRLTDIEAITPKPSPLIIEVVPIEKAGPSTSHVSQTNTLTKAEAEAKQAVIKAFPNPFVHVRDISVDAIHVEPLDTGFKFFNDHLVLKKDRPEIIIVGARPGHGKSALMMQIAGNVAMKYPVLVFSLEMCHFDLKARLVAPRISAPLDKLLKGQIDDKKRHSADKIFDSMQLSICANGIRNVTYMCQQAFDFSKQTKPQLVVVDYLQKASGPSKPNRTGELAEILGQLKELAVQLNCPVMVGSQLNRNCESRGKEGEMKKGIGDYKPIVSDLMDSSAIDADADVIVMLSRQFLYDRRRAGEADIILAKNRSGKVGETVFNYSGELVSFYEQNSDRRGI